MLKYLLVSWILLVPPIHGHVSAQQIKDLSGSTTRGSESTFEELDGCIVSTCKSDSPRTCQKDFFGLQMHKGAKGRVLWRNLNIKTSLADPSNHPAASKTSSAGQRTNSTELTIVGEDFYINGKPTYAGHEWNGHRMEGLLLNTRMVQATFDDRNPETAPRWSYPDTGKWDAERNVTEFIAAMPSWKEHGLLAVTVNFQGGSPEGYSNRQTWITGAFDEDGSLRNDYADRMRRVLDAADELGMTVILGYFYFGQDQHLRDKAAVVRATDETTRWLLEGGWRNVIVEVNNETNVKAYDHNILKPDRVHELIERVRSNEKNGRRLLVGTSYGGGAIPTENVVRVSDFLLIHGNGVSDPDRISAMIHQTRQVRGYKPMPILFNEDDHENFDQPKNNFTAALEEHVSWGWFDYRRKGETLEHGYQSPPVDWGINSPRKKAFFGLLQQVTKEAPGQK